jgi:hypothetical protein
MLVHSVFVPPDGGEIDYSLDFDLPAVPHAGDYISIDLEGEDGTRDFIVRRTWWSLGHPAVDEVAQADNAGRGSLKGLNVECEFALGGHTAESHQRACMRYEKKHGLRREFDASMY